MKLKLINIYKLNDLSFDKNLIDPNIISCLNRLLIAHDSNYLRKNLLENMDLLVGNSYQLNDNGALTIPWNWDE
jgi:hypothetical protein